VSTGSPRPQEYRHKRNASEVRCYYVLNPGSPHADWALRAVIGPAFRALHADYGLTAEPLAFGELPRPDPARLTYAVYGPTNPLAMPAVERAYVAALATTGARTNLISAYPLTRAGTDRPDYARARTVVPELCDALDINAIFPDDLDPVRGIRTNNWRDLYVNVIGETIRVKYRPVESLDPADAALREGLCRAHAADVAELARLYREHRLWQRKPYTDGAVTFSLGGRWLVSQTVTDKTLMTAADFDLVTAFDERQGTITYTGPRLPSSDAPEFLVLSGLLGARPRLIVHFHHLELTRGARHRDLVSDSTIESGRFAAGRHYHAELRRRSTDWFIAREHGVVWTGASVEQFAAFADRVVAAGG
jgi:hypothetical protein